MYVSRTLEEHACVWATLAWHHDHRSMDVSKHLTPQTRLHFLMPICTSSLPLFTFIKITRDMETSDTVAHNDQLIHCRCSEEC